MPPLLPRDIVSDLMLVAVVGGWNCSTLRNGCKSKTRRSRSHRPSYSLFLDCQSLLTFDETHLCTPRKLRAAVKSNSPRNGRPVGSVVAPDGDIRQRMSVACGGVVAELNVKEAKLSLFSFRGMRHTTLDDRAKTKPMTHRELEVCERETQRNALCWRLEA